MTEFWFAVVGYALFVLLVMRIARSAKARSSAERDADRKDGRR